MVLDRLSDFLGNKAASIATKAQEIRQLIDNDPVAKKVSWKPARRGGRVLLLSHRAKMIGKDRLVFQPTIWSWLIHLVLIMVGLLIVAFARPDTLLGDPKPEGLLTLLFGVLTLLWAIYKTWSTV